MLRHATEQKTIQSSSSYNKSLERKKSNKLQLKTVASSRGPSKVSIFHRLKTDSNKNQKAAPLQPEWQVLYNRRQSYLNSLFNRRRSILESISRKNRQIYSSIVTQQSHYCYSKLEKDESTDKNKPTIQNLTEGSRIMLALSRQAMNKTNSTPQSMNKINSTPHRLRPILQKQNNPMKIIEEVPNINKKLTSKMLCAILQKASTFNVNSTGLGKVVQSRYIKQDVLPPFNQAIASSTQLRNRPACKPKPNDIFTNF